MMNKVCGFCALASSCDFHAYYLKKAFCCTEEYKERLNFIKHFLLLAVLRFAAQKEAIYRFFTLKDNAVYYCYVLY